MDLGFCVFELEMNTEFGSKVHCAISYRFSLRLSTVNLLVASMKCSILNRFKGLIRGQPYRRNQGQVPGKLGEKFRKI